jgi:hypothetical protein
MPWRKVEPGSDEAFERFIYYLTIAEEIDAAMRADFTLSQREVGRHIGRSQSWVSRLLKWYRALPPLEND